MNAQINKVVDDSNDKFILKEVAFKMINKTDDNIERCRKELNDFRDKMRMIPSEISNLNSVVIELRKFKAEKL